MLLVALLPLFALVNSERLDEEEVAREYVVHKENDFRAPDFDLSQLKVREESDLQISVTSKVLFSGMAEVPGCPEEHQHMTVFEWALLSFGCWCNSFDSQVCLWRRRGQSGQN